MALNTNSGGNNNTWGVSNQAIDSDYDRWLVRGRHVHEDSQVMRNYIRNLNKSNTGLPPIYSSCENFNAYMSKLYRLKNRMETLSRMYASLNFMCQDFPETRFDCLKELQEATEEHNSFFRDMMRQVNSVPLEKRRAAIGDA